MPYKSGSNIDPEIMKREMELLSRGFNYTEVSKSTESKVKTIAERNRVVYKIDIWDSFRQRINREGIPNRLTATDEFGYWFAGFFDGEGSFNFYTLYRRGIPNYRVGIHIALRDDDIEVIKFIQQNLGVGRIYRKPARNATNPSVEFAVRAYNELAEVIIPLFDRYPLKSRKAKEFEFWKIGVIELYIRTLGGYSTRKAMTEEEKSFFENIAKRIKELKSYPSIGVSIPKV